MYKGEGREWPDHVQGRGKGVTEGATEGEV